ncbi:DUF2971 domain-containing protein [Pantoea ananatis]|uniref:DUF2971 domain-containing protein n=1 Tax=Pantoea ananas TaxID=553 RepID=UPI002222BE25|nr:DUF2971 domain-containing protein [Pantoea ananatis]MCW1834082.1 DUF2971 domain-containing protein [Pantoea ananatis]
MDHEQPKFLYKYRSISNNHDLAADYSLTNLINCESIFSSRLNFNDLFDSKIQLINPTPKEIKELSFLCEKSKRHMLQSYIYKGNFTLEGEKILADIDEQLTKLIDSYAFICLSSRADSNLMWSHYADSHKGFCIEFKSEYIKAEKVTYANRIPSLKTIDLMKVSLFDGPHEKLGNDILAALCTKLEEWKYESEYRVILSRKQAEILGPPYFKKVAYDRQWVESVIFGCRMDKDIKNYIIKNLPEGTKFKQAVPGLSRIEIKPFQG